MDEPVKTALWREALEWAKTLILAMLFAWLFTKFVIVNAVVPTGSMEDTVNIKDRIIASRLSYVFSEPQRYDIIVFEGHDDDKRLFLKRVIGMPGDKLYIQGGEVYVEGIDGPLRSDFVKGELDGNYPLPSIRNSHVTVPYDGSPPYITIPEGHYFVMGDNRTRSSDSRHWGIQDASRTFISSEQILGKGIFKYYPRIQSLTN